jgi:tetratricopeptide (TPR) repeat protein
MTRRAWIAVAVIAAVVLTPVIAYVSLHLWIRSHIVELANAQPSNSEPLPTDDPLTALQKKARIAERAKDYQRAVDLYTEGLADSTRPAEVRRNLIRQRAFAYEDLHRYDLAEADYNAALAIEPLDPDFYAKRGFYLIRRERYDEALADFRKGGALLPADGGFPYGEGQAFEKLGQHDKAVERYTEAIARNAKVTTYYRERGSAYNYLAKYKEAVADYDNALALGYSFEVPRETAMAHLGRGYALLRLDQYHPAIADFDAVLKVVPHSSNALGWRGAAYQGLGDRAKAVADYKAALAIDPKNERILNSLKFLGEPPP